MLFTCLPEGAPIPGRFPGPPHPRGKYLTVDIHCHVLTEKAEAMFNAAGLIERRPRDVFANPRTRAVNQEQARRNRTQFTSIEKRLADMDVMGIDIQAITPAPIRRITTPRRIWGSPRRARSTTTSRRSWRGIPTASPG